MLSELLSIFLLGLINGFTVCSFSCMPILGSYVMITGNGFRDGLVSAFSFVSGKTLSYMVLGSAASLMGGVFVHTGISHMHVVTGIILILAGISLPFLSGMSCDSGCGSRVKRMSLFTMGLSSGFIPCPSMAAVFLIAAAKNSMISGAACGMAYGVGLAVSPLLLLSGAVSTISEKIKDEAGHYMPSLQVISAMILVSLGFRVMFQEV